MPAETAADPAPATTRPVPDAERPRALARALGRRVRDRRRALKRPQKWLAARVGYAGQATIANIEAGNMLPGPATIPALCRALGLSPNQLFGWGDVP